MTTITHIYCTDCDCMWSPEIYPRCPVCEALSEAKEQHEARQCQPIALT